MIQANLLAKYIIAFCNKNGLLISNLKLQKILYFVQLYSIKNSSNKIGVLPPDSFEAWQFGPVIPEVYFKYSLNGGNPIFEDELPFPQSDFDNLIKKLASLNAWDLVVKTHKNGGAWENTYKNFGLGRKINEKLLVQEAESLDDMQ